MNKSLTDNKEINLLTPFSVISTKDATEVGAESTITIAGYASYCGMDANGKTYVDLAGDVLSVEGIDLSVWTTNSIILMGHDRAKVIGKGISVEKRSDGLYIECEIYKSATDPQDWYRIYNGLISTFSCGFRTRNAIFKEMDGEEVYFITSSLLLEVSVTGLPCNSMSKFSKKSLSLIDLEEDTKKVEPTNHKEDDPMKITVKRADLLSAADLEKFKALGGDVEADVEISLADFIKDSVAKEVAAILAAKEAEAVAAAEVAKAEALAAETAKAETEALAQAEALVQEEKELNDELFVLKELVENLTAAISTEEN